MHMNPVDLQRSGHAQALQLNRSSPNGPSGDARATGFAQALSKASSGDADKGQWLTVEKGDTLVGLTRRHLQGQAIRPPASELYRLSLEVARHNGITDANLIKVGQRLDFSNLLMPGQPQVSAPKSNHQDPTPLKAGEIASSPSANAVPPKRVAVIGDSIAVGIGGALIKQSGGAPRYAEGRKFLNQVTEQLVVDATGGHSSPQILRKLSANPQLHHADLAIISVGTNDLVNSTVNAYYTPERISANLQKIRDQMQAKSNVWVLPYDDKARELVLHVAQRNGDQTLDLANFQKADRHHPKNYAEIANALSSSRLARDSGITSSPAQPASEWPSTLSALMARAGATQRAP